MISPDPGRSGYLSTGQILRLAGNLSLGRQNNAAIPTTRCARGGAWGLSEQIQQRRARRDRARKAVAAEA